MHSTTPLAVTLLKKVIIKDTNIHLKIFYLSGILLLEDTALGITMHCIAVDIVQVLLAGLD